MWGHPLGLGDLGTEAGHGVLVTTGKPPIWPWDTCGNCGLGLLPASGAPWCPQQELQALQGLEPITVSSCPSLCLK